MRFRAWLVIVGLLPLAFTSCVFSSQPLSDDTNSFLDEQLIGYWETIGDDSKLKFLIGRKPDTKNTLALVSLPILTDEGLVKESEVYTINVRKGKTGNYLSLGFKDKAKKPLYWMCKYDMPDKNKIRMFILDETFFEYAVKRGELKERTASADPKDAGNKPNDAGAAKSIKRGVFLSDTPDQIFNFLEKHGAKCFAKEPGVYLRYRATD